MINKIADNLWAGFLDISGQSHTFWLAFGIGLGMSLLCGWRVTL